MSFNVKKFVNQYPGYPWVAVVEQAYKQGCSDTEKKREKYQWHDRNEDGDDIPAVGEYIEIAIDYYDYGGVNYDHTEYFVGFMDECQSFYDTASDYVCDIEDVDKWRIHEPFEEDDTK